MRSLCVLAAILLAAPAVHAELVHKSGRGVSYLDGAPCPLAGVGARAANACSRVAFDDEFSTATFDPATRRLVIENTHRYATTRTIGDVVLMATGTTVADARLALAVHLRIDKSGDRFSVDLHPHALPGTTLKAAEVEPWEVVLSDGKTQQTVYTKDKGQKALMVRSLISRLLSVELTPLGATGGASPLDLTVRILGKQLLRLELLPAPGTTPASVTQLLQSGNFTFRITPRTRWLPKKDITRDVFLYGLEGAPAIADLARTGFKKGEPLVLAVTGGKGQLTYRGHTSETSDMGEVVEATRAFLEFNSLGIALRIMADERLAQLHSAAAK